jgi:WD40 repeat protein
MEIALMNETDIVFGELMLPIGPINVRGHVKPPLVRLLASNTHRYTAICISYDGTLVFIADGSFKISVRDIEDYDVIGELVGHTARVNAIRSSQDWIASCSEDNTIRLWDPITCTCSLMINTVQPKGIAFSPSGDLLASYSVSFIDIWDPHTGQHERRVKGVPSPRLTIVDLLFTPDSNLISTSGTGYRVVNPLTGELLSDNTIGQFRKMKLSDDGSTIALVSLRSGTTVDLFDLGTNELILSREFPRIYDIMFAIGQTIVVCTLNGVYVWDVAENNIIRLLDTKHRHVIGYIPRNVLL